MKRKKKTQTEKNYFHEPMEAAKAQITSVKSMQYSVDTDKTQLSRQIIKRKNIWHGQEPETIKKADCNLSGAYPYLFEKTAFYCTHYPEYVDMSDPDYGRIVISWEEFCKGIKRKKAMQDELAGIVKNVPAKCIDIGNRYVFAPPFIVLLHSKDKETLSLQALSHAENIGRCPIDTITIRFFKPLFENYLNGKGKYHNLPLGWYDTLQDFIEEKRLKTNPAHVMKAWTYLNIHDNAIGDCKMVNLFDLLLHVDPQSLEIKEGKLYLRNSRTKTFLLDTMITLQEVTQRYKGILNFVFDGIAVPEDSHIPDLPYANRIDIILKSLEISQGYIELAITRNPKTMIKKRGVQT